MSMPQVLTDLDEIIFEPKDIEIFKIPDVKTKINTLQNYFFPRMEVLLRHTLDRVQEIYGVNPYKWMSFSYHPSNRPSAKENFLIPYVRLGIIGKKRRGKTLTTIKRNGEPFHDRTSRLTYYVHPNGAMNVIFYPFFQYTNRALC
jgi:hypothetical protein